MGIRLAVLASYVASLVLLLPGRIGTDEIDMYRQAVGSAYHDWHSPLISWVWHLLIEIRPGALPMTVLQASVYFAGVFLLATALERMRHPIAAWLVLLASVYPVTWIGLESTGNKDVLLTATMLLALGCLARAGVAEKPRHLWWLAGAMLAVTTGLCVRINGIFAVFPVMVGALGFAIGARPTFLRRLAVLVGAGVACVALLAGSTALLRAALPVERSNSLASLLIFDLAGVSARTGADEAQGLLGDDFASRAAECYDPYFWDTFFTIGRPCRETWEQSFETAVQDPGDVERMRQLQSAWLESVGQHFTEYANHRLAHLSKALGFGPRPTWADVMFTIHHENRDPTGDVRQLGPALVAIDAVAISKGAVAAVWPYVVVIAMLVTLVCSALLPKSPSRVLTIVTTASGLLYAGGYLFVGVSSHLRYMHWPAVAAMLGLALLSASIRQGRQR